MKFLFLGTGASAGVPMIACGCGVCKSVEVKNVRLRACGLLQKEGRNFLIDVSPDIRNVSLKYNISHIDGIFITHPHEDHIGGMNDLRAFSFFNNNTKIPLILSNSTMSVMNSRFDYLLDRFEIEVLDAHKGELVVEGLKTTYFTYWQEGLSVMGFRFGNFAYMTDIKDYDPSIYDDLDGVETLVIGAIHEEMSRMHFSIGEAIAFKDKIKSVKRCYLTHLSHQVDHKTISKTLPKGVMLAYDGLEIDV